MLPDKLSAHDTGQRIKSSHVDPLRKNLKKYGRINMIKQSSICTLACKLVISRDRFIFS